jgi:hypothetical protein
MAAFNRSAQEIIHSKKPKCLRSRIPVGSDVKEFDLCCYFSEYTGGVYRCQSAGMSYFFFSGSHCSVSKVTSFLCNLCYLSTIQIHDVGRGSGSEGGRNRAVLGRMTL